MTAKEISRRSRDREGEILNVAARHLNTVGVSLEWFGVISEELGITRPALYTYFADREDLLFRCYEKTCDRLDDRLRRAMETSDDTVAILSGFLADADALGVESAVLSEVMALPPDKRDLIWARQHALVAELTTLLGRGIETGILRPLAPQIAANAIIGLASWAPIYSRWGVGADLDLVAEGSRELLFHGLAAKGSAAVGKPERLAPLVSGQLDVFDRTAIDAAKREGILVAASALFNSRGIGTTRVEEVGAAVGLSKRGIYRYVGHKQDLVEACVRRANAYFLAVMDAAEQLDASRLDAMYAAVRDVIWAEIDPSVTILTPYVGFGLLDAAAQRESIDAAQRLTEGYRRILGQGVAEGSIRPLPLDAILASLPGVFTWASKASEQPGHDRDRITDELATLVALGILAPERP